MTEITGFTADWRHHHPYLVNLAYQMLGDVGDAEDVAQEAFLRLSRTQPGEIEDVRAWLTTVAGRLCLDVVRSARARRMMRANGGRSRPWERRDCRPCSRNAPPRS